MVARKYKADITATIYHNPACETSRNTLAMIRQSGVEPVVVEYLKNPPTRARLVELLREMGITPRELLRAKRGTPYAELGLADPKWSEDELIGFMSSTHSVDKTADRRDAQGRAAVPASGEGAGDF